MLQVFVFCSVFGGTILVIQTLLTLLGIGDMDGVGDDVDFDGDGSEVGHSHSGFGVFKFVSLRTAVAGIAFFGLAGWGMLASTGNPLLAIVAAALAGLTAVFVVYSIYKWMDSMKYDGNVSEKNLVGATGSVYVRVPPQGKGAGKVLVTQQNRTMEYEALSSSVELPTGTQITVTKVISPSTVEVSEVR
jgi:NfeD-like.